MTVESTLVHGLKKTILDTDYKIEYDENLDLLDPNRITSGLLSARPVAGSVNRFYYATDTRQYSYDNGISWETIEAKPTSHSTTHVFGGGDEITDVTSNTTHRASDGTDHANVVLNDTHRGNVSNPHTVTAVQAGAEPTLGFTPENSANKGVYGGYVELDINGYAVGYVLASRLISGTVPAARLPYATESIKGAVMLINSAGATAGIDITMPVTPARVFDILNSSTLRNMMLNGCFDVWQRGTSFSTPATNAFTADRWLTKYNGSGSTFTVSKQAFTLGQTDVPNEPASYLRYDVTVAGSGESFRQINNIIESVRSLAGKKVTLSFYAKASSSINLPNVRMQQYFGSGGSPSSSIYTTFVSSVSIGTSWAKYSASITIPSISGKTLGTNSNDYLSVDVGMPTNSAFQLDIAQFQLEPGEIATAFELRSTNHEIMHCQRYYIDFTGRTINGDLWVSWPTTMRSAPTLTTTAGTVANASVNGCTVNNSAAAATIITAASEM